MKQKSIKNIRKEFKDNGIFYTPPELAKKLIEYVEVQPTTVYDPTCGAGNLLRVFPDNVKKYGQELDEEQLKLIDIPNFTGAAGDTLMDDKFAGMKFSCIVANPPFSVKWNPDVVKNDVRFAEVPELPPPSKADWAFLIHILSHIDDNGVAVVLEFPGILYRGQREGKVRKWFVENNYIDRVVNIPGNTFEDTAISTCIIVIKKNRSTTDIIFEDAGRKETVPLEEIQKNDFNLSPNLYIQEETENVEIDPMILESKARQSFLEKFKKELEFERMVCEMEGISMKPLINAIKRILQQYESPKTETIKTEGQMTLFN